MAVIHYGIGYIISLGLLYFGAKLYFTEDQFDALGAKIMVMAGILVIALLWPISVPTMAALLIKKSLEEVYNETKKVFEEAD